MESVSTKNHRTSEAAGLVFTETETEAEKLDLAELERAAGADGKGLSAFN